LNLVDISYLPISPNSYPQLSQLSMTCASCDCNVYSSNTVTLL